MSLYCYNAFSYLYDHLGNTRVVYTASFNCATPSTQTRTLELMSDYYPFGKVLRAFDPAPADEKYLMTQKERDSETGLDYFGARYYDSDVCRWLSVDPLGTERPGLSSYNYVQNNPLLLVDPDGALDDKYYTMMDGKIQVIKTNDNFDQFYTEQSDGSFFYEAKLSKNSAGLVLFASSGPGYSRYGPIDAGGSSKGENVGNGDHYLNPITAAALFGVISDLRQSNINISFGDMSSSNGSDPWASGSKHHSGHGHKGKRVGLDVDFRYIDHSGNSFQSKTATTDSSFDQNFNTMVYTSASSRGFGKNYQGTLGGVPSVTRIKDHNDHGHLGLTIKNLNITYVTHPPTKVVAPIITLPADIMGN